MKKPKKRSRFLARKTARFFNTTFTGGPHYEPIKWSRTWDRGFMVAALFLLVHHLLRWGCSGGSGARSSRGKQNHYLFQCGTVVGR